MRVALEFALWVRVTPVVLALRSSATDWPAGFEVVDEPTTRPRIVSVLTTVDRVPDRSTRPNADARSPVTPPASMPELDRLFTTAPASMRTAVPDVASFEVDPPVIPPSLSIWGITEPARICTPVPSDSWPEPSTLPTTRIPPSRWTVPPTSPI